MGNICSKKSNASEKENECTDDEKGKDNEGKLSSSNNQMGKKEIRDNLDNAHEEELKIIKKLSNEKKNKNQNNSKKNKNLKIEEKMNYENYITNKNKNEEFSENTFTLCNEDEKEKEKDISQNYTLPFIEKPNLKYNISLGINRCIKNSIFNIFKNK